MHHECITEISTDQRAGVAPRKPKVVDRHILLHHLVNKFVSMGFDLSKWSLFSVTRLVDREAMVLLRFSVLKPWAAAIAFKHGPFKAGDSLTSFVAHSWLNTTLCGAVLPGKVVIGC